MTALTNNWLLFVMIILASYRFTHLIVFDKITEFLRNPFMKEKRITEGGVEKVKKVPTSKIGYLLNCYWCAGVWSAILLGIGYLYFSSVFLPIIFILSIAGAQAILETFVGVGTKMIAVLDKYADRLK